MRRLTALTCLAIAFCLAPRSAAAQSFDGVTIIELSDEAAGEAIKGKAAGDPYIVTFVSAQGSYAALGARDARSCVAWAQPGSYTGASIAFGLPPSEQSLKLVHPSVCQPFTLSLVDAERVRVEASNRYERTSGPLAPNAKEVRYAGEHRIVARVPLIAFDWGMPTFARYAVKGAPLGPLPALRERLGANAKFDLSPLQRSSSGVRKLLTITMPRPADPTNSTTVAGHVAAAEVLAWPWDVLYVGAYYERLAEPSLTEAFEQAVVERYGQPSRSAPGIRAGTRHLQWFFDLQGRQLPVGAAAPGNCLSTRESWIDEVEFRTIDRDFGPWGCALIMLLIHDGMRGTVREYSVQAASGYVMALNHFIRRLEELRPMREKIQAVQAYKPKL